MNNRRAVASAYTLADFVGMWFDKVADEKGTEGAKFQTPDDPFVFLESELTNAELHELMRAHQRSNIVANEQTLQPFTDFLAKRWQRVSSTKASYDQAANSQPSLFCDFLAKGIARAVLARKNITQDEKDRYLKPTPAAKRNYPDDDLKTATLAHIDKIYQCGEDLVKFMKDIPERDWATVWPDLLKSCPKSALIKLFFEGDFDRNFKRMVSSGLLFTGSLAHDKAMLYCLTECYKRHRDNEKPYLGWCMGVTGYARTSKIREAEILQAFLIDPDLPFDRQGLDNYLAKHVVDGKTHGALSDGRLGDLVAVIRQAGELALTEVAGSKLG